MRCGLYEGLKNVFSILILLRSEDLMSFAKKFITNFQSKLSLDRNHIQTLTIVSAFCLLGHIFIYFKNKNKIDIMNGKQDFLRLAIYG